VTNKQRGAGAARKGLQDEHYIGPIVFISTRIFPETPPVMEPNEKEHTGEEEIEIQPLRGKRPDGVVGEMKPRKFIERIRRAQREGNLEEEEASWRELEPYLRDSENAPPDS
jgi:hypothetical protein